MPGLVISYKDIPTPSLPLMILSFFSHIWLRCQQFLSHPDGLCVFRCVSTRKGTVVFHLPFWRRPFSPHRAGLYALAQYLKKYHSKQQHQKIIFFSIFSSNFANMLSMRRSSCYMYVSLHSPLCRCPNLITMSTCAGTMCCTASLPFSAHCIA